MVTPSRIWPGCASGLFILLLISSALLSLFFAAQELSINSLWQDPYLIHVTTFSLKQALLSTLLSVGLALPVALALFHRNFAGKTLLLRLCTMTLVLPVLVGVFGILAIYGKQGILQQTLPLLGIDWQWNIYGLNGILLAHVLFNLPFCVQLFVQALSQIPSTQHRLSRQLGLTGWGLFQHLEWHYLKQQLPHAAGLVFMLCFTSFTIVMALGGGPNATTIELAIYQAIRFDFDLQTGALLAMWQLCLCAGFHLFFKYCTRPIDILGEDNTVTTAAFVDSLPLKIWDYVWIGALVIFMVPPLLMVVLKGLNASLLNLLTEPAFIDASLNSLSIALGSAFGGLLFGSSIILTSRFWRFHGFTQRANGIEMIASLILVVPSVVLATGLFLILRDHIDVFSSPYVLVLLVNTLMALPYTINVLSQPAYQLTQQYQSLCDSLGIKGINRLRLVEWQLLRAPIARAIAVSFVLSSGDLSAIALVGTQEFQTLPLYLYQLMGSYQMQAAASTALLLLVFSLLSYSLIEYILVRKRHAIAQ